MTETTTILTIVFGMPVAIVALVLHYRLKRMRLEAGHGESEPGPAGQKDWVDLARRAEDLQTRIRNLEDILVDGKEEKIA